MINSSRQISIRLNDFIYFFPIKSKFYFITSRYLKIEIQENYFLIRDRSFAEAQPYFNEPVKFRSKGSVADAYFGVFETVEQYNLF